MLSRLQLWLFSMLMAVSKSDYRTHKAARFPVLVKRVRDLTVEIGAIHLIQSSHEDSYEDTQS